MARAHVAYRCRPRRHPPVHLERDTPAQPLPPSIAVPIAQHRSVAFFNLLSMTHLNKYKNDENARLGGVRCDRIEYASWSGDAQLPVFLDDISTNLFYICSTIQPPRTITGRLTCSNVSTVMIWIDTIMSKMPCKYVNKKKCNNLCNGCFSIAAYKNRLVLGMNGHRRPRRGQCTDSHTPTKASAL